MRSNLGVLRGAQGQLEKSEALLRGSLRGLRSVAGAHHSLTLLSISYLADICKLLGRREEAVGLFREVAAGREAMLGARHPSTARARAALEETMLQSF